MTIVYIIIVAVVLGLVPAFMAGRQGRSFVKWWIYGALAFPAAIVHALVLNPGHVVKCPFCGGMTNVGKGYCRRCGYEFI